MLGYLGFSKTVCCIRNCFFCLVFSLGYKTLLVLKETYFHIFGGFVLFLSSEKCLKLVKHLFSSLFEATFSLKQLFRL